MQIYIDILHFMKTYEFYLGLYLHVLSNNNSEELREQVQVSAEAKLW